jgi:16S rRNA (guanine527-N7)-methyltransferase
MDAPDRSSLPRRASSTPPLDPIFGEVVETGLTALGLTLDPAARAVIDDHARLLMAWNEHINLSGLRTAEQVARGHVLDSLIALPALRELGHSLPSLLDLGSGGGFPGLPLAVALPARVAALVDSITKKARFLEVAALAAKGVVVVASLAERAEDLADEPDERESWDIVTARAVGTVAEVAELGLPLARVGGHVVAWKSASAESEISDAGKIIRLVGGANARIVVLPGAAAVGLAGHCLVIIDKVRPSPDGYPRSAGERRRRPLG